MSFATKSISILLTRIAVITVTFAGGVISTRILGPVNRGVLNVLTLLPALAINFGHLGIGNANLYFVAKKKKSLEEITANSLSISMMLGIFLILVSYLVFFKFRNSIFDGSPLEFTPLAFGWIPFALFRKYTAYTVMAKEEVSARNAIVFYPVVIRFALIICLMVLIRMNLFGMLMAEFGSYLLGFCLCLYLVSRRTKIRWAFDAKLFIDSVKFGIVPFCALLIINLIYRADIFLVKYFIDDAAVGLYTLAVSVVEMLGIIPEAIANILLARVSNLTEKDANQFTPKVCRFSILICVIGGVCLLGIGPYAVPFIYGKEFIGSIGPLMILIPGIVFMQLFLLLHSDLTGRGKAYITVYIFGLALVGNLVLNVLWIPRFGINGAAAASSVSYCLGAVILALTFSSLTKVGLRKLLVLTKSDVLEFYFSMKNSLLELAGRKERLT